MMYGFLLTFSFFVQNLASLITRLCSLALPIIVIKVVEFQPVGYKNIFQIDGKSQKFIFHEIYVDIFPF